MRSVMVASAVRGSRVLALGGLVAALVLGGTAPAGASTLAESADSSDSYTGIGGLVGVLAVGLGIVGLVVGTLRRRRGAVDTCAANAPVGEHTTIAAPTPAETTGGWATEPLAVPTRAVPARAHRPQPARPQPQRTQPQRTQSARFPAGQRLTTR